MILGPGPGIGLEAAARRAKQAIGVDPSTVMLDACRRRCKDLIDQGRVRLEQGTADRTGETEASVDVVLAVNNVQIWPDRRSAFAELSRVSDPAGGSCSRHTKNGCPAD